MSRLDRYIFMTAAVAFVGVTAVLAAMIWSTQALRQLDLVTSQGQTILAFISITSLTMPTLVLVIAPFFTSFLLRTLSWKLILADDGYVVNFLQALHLLGDDGRLLATPFAIIAGLTYNFLPFMVLPLFASIDKIDHRLIEASSDLFANPFVGFWKVTWPLSLPGVVSGTLLTFIPAVGDYINQALLGTPNQRMIGTVIQSQFTDANNYPIAAALSMILMLLILAMVLVYVRRAGTEELL